MDTIELEWRLLYAIVVAGKSQSFADVAMRRFYPSCDQTPFEQIRELDAAGTLDARIRSARMGNYNKLLLAFRSIANSKLDLNTCSLAQLEEHHGIGYKTSRFFLLWTRPGVEFAALDTHVLKWLRFIGYEAPKATPSSSSQYEELEKLFLQEAKARGLPARILDAAIWDFCSKQTKHCELWQWPTHLQRGTPEFPKDLRALYESWQKED